jgi:hypothetical protein
MQLFLLVMLAMCISFSFGYAAHIYDVRKNVKNGLLPYIDDANGLCWRIDRDEK